MHSIPESYIAEFERELELRGWNLPLAIQQRAGIFFYHLHQKNQQFNLTGYQNLPDYLDYHLADTLVLSRIMDPLGGSTLADVGSGGGVPGLLLKLLHPEWQVTLLESNQKKARFLEEMGEILELADCTVVAGRAEEAAHAPEWRERMDFAVARALGPLPVALELTAGFARVGGWIVLPRGGEEDVEEDARLVAGEFHCRLERVVPYTLPGRNRPFQVAVYEKVAALAEKYPRKPGRIRKRPFYP